MLILYIPFKSNECNDILWRAKSWINNLKLGTKAAIIQHGEKVHLEHLESDAKVYILGHGINQFIYPQFTNYIASTQDEKTAIILPIEEIARRFKKDFYSHQSKNCTIKLYFCSYKDNPEIAQRFEKSIKDLHNIRIDYYVGNINSPQFGDHKYAILYDRFLLRASQSRHSLYHYANKAKEHLAKDIMNSNNNKHKSVKEISKSFFSSKQKRINSFFEKNKEEKSNLYLQNRIDGETLAMEID